MGDYSLEQTFLIEDFLNKMPVATSITDLNDDSIYFMNREAEEIFGYRWQFGRRMSDYCSCKKDYKALINLVKDRKEVKDFKTGMLAVGGEKIPFVVSAKLINYKGKTCKLCSFTDISREIKYKHESERDGLTNAFNLRAFENIAEAEFKRSKRHNRPLTFLVLDIDYFKKINDTFGHSAGDKALIEFSKTVQSMLRKSDTLARIGGEEFAVVLPETDSRGAKRIAERIREEVSCIRVSTHTGTESDSFGYTVSIGISSLFASDSSHDALKDRADKALYEAKESGRDKTYIYKL